MQGDPEVAGVRSPSGAHQTLLTRGAPLGRYLVLDTLGVGGMGVVYAAYDPELDRKVAVKLVRPTADGGEHSEDRARLLREAQAMARVMHPNVVTVHDVGTVGDAVFVAREFIEGYSLREYLDGESDEPPTWRRSLQILIEAGRGLAAAHDSGLIHRDFKPDNVMVEKGGRVVVMDFGLARGATGQKIDPRSSVEARLDEIRLDDTVTQAGAIMGTPAYMPPEQCLGVPADARSDQFSYCVTVYEALYGERPFQGSTLAEVMIAITNGEMREPKSGEVPRYLRRVVARGLATEAAQRWPSMRELLEALGRDPAARRRPWILAGGALVVGGGVATSFIARSQLEREQKLEACDARAAEIDDVWSAEAKARLSEALVLPDGGHDDASTSRVLSAVVAFRGRWATGRHAVCVQHSVDETLDEAAHARAVACFDSQLDRLDALLEVYAGQPGQPGSSAVRAAMTLPQLDDCADAATLSQRPAAPSDPDTRATIADARRTLARASAQAGVGEYKRADELAAAVLEQATALGWAPLEAEARLVAATIEEQLGRYDESVAELHEAFALAAEASDDVLAAQAAVRLLRVLGYHLARGGEALTWARVAEALLTRLHRDDGPDAAQLANDRGLTLQALGDLEGAEAAHREALALRRSLYGEEHGDLGHSYGNLGNVALRLGKLEPARHWHQLALTVRTQALGPAHPDTARSHLHLARVHLAAGDLERAETEAERSRAILEPTFGTEHRVTARVLATLADARRAAGRLDEALELYRRAHGIRQDRLGELHPETAETALALAELHAGRQQHGPALRYYQEAARAYEHLLGAENDATVRARDGIFLLCDAGHLAACQGP